jgi:hypothetical protein
MHGFARLAVHLPNQMPAFAAPHSPSESDAQAALDQRNAHEPRDESTMTSGTMMKINATIAADNARDANDGSNTVAMAEISAGIK